MKVLGVWDGHDSGAALIVEGRLVAAVNEERLSRRKLEVSFPSAAIRECLDLGGIRPEEVEIVAACTTDVAKAIGRLFPSTKEAYYQLRRRLREPGPISLLRKRAKYWITELGPNPISAWASRAALGRQIHRLGLDGARLRLFDHHLSHAATAISASGFDRAVILTMDGVGDGLAATVSAFDGGRLTLLDRTPSRDSPGIFFEHVTNLLNMRELEDEGKVTALACFGARPNHNPLASLLRAEGTRFRTGRPGHSLYGRLRRLHWRYPNEQFARMAQDALELACVAVAREAVRRTGIGNVALAGGVASNIHTNRRIRMLPEVDDVFVFPHMGDGGLGLGAALLAAGSEMSPLRIDLQSLALGRGYDDDEVRKSLDSAGAEYRRSPALVEAVADLLMADRVVLWFQGRSEYGPRALGQRSILARPDQPAARDRLNRVLKRRTWYQPFCPSILQEDAARVFSDWKGSPNRFMTMGYQLREEYRPALAAVISVDGTCRPQIVPDDSTGPFADLLRLMQRRLGIGAVLNTSFNIHGEPLVSTPAEAVDVFRRSGADALAIGPFLIDRKASAS